jgi:mRNA interferase HigB
MNVVSKRTLREFWVNNKQSEIPLDTWYRIAKKATWQNLVEVQNDFPHADLVGQCVVFNIGGNKFRLVTKIEFQKQVIFVKFILSHSEYDKNLWKKDCGC